MGPIAATARARRAVGIDMRSGSALLLGVLIIVSRPTCHCPRSTHTIAKRARRPGAGWHGTGRAARDRGRAPPVPVSTADPASRRAAPTRTGSRRQTSKTCRAALTVLNVLDRVNLIRPAEGIGIFQSAYGPRLTVLNTLTIPF
jgi:hypothetical protein